MSKTQYSEGTLQISTTPCSDQWLMWAKETKEILMVLKDSMLPQASEEYIEVIIGGGQPHIGVDGSPIDSYEGKDDGGSESYDGNNIQVS